jgi:hypothetical protein
VRRFRPGTWVSAIAGTGIFGGLCALALILAAAPAAGFAALTATIGVIAVEWFAWSDTRTRDR